MGLRQAFTGFFEGLRKGSIPVMGGMTQAPAHPVSVQSALSTVRQSAQNGIDVIDTLKPPNSSNIPGSWTRAWMPPGKPLTTQNYNEEEKEAEPRSFQYVASINSTISPRIGYGLMAFADLKQYGLNVPEVALCLRISTEELKAFIPTIVDENDEKIDVPELDWMTKNPDGFNPWPVWLSRFLFNTMIYDAPAVYKIRDVTNTDVIKKGKYFQKETELINLKEGDGDNQVTVPVLRWYCVKCGSANDYNAEREKLVKEININYRICSNCGGGMTKKQVRQIEHEYVPPKKSNKLEKGKTITNNAPIVGLRIIDGSTIFAVIDETGEQPQPPAPAFTQVIWGMPRMFMNTYQLWYRPRFLRPDAPYGKTFIEDSLPSVKLLAQLWDYELAKYTVGNLPEAAYTAPPDWKSVEQILEFEATFNDRMAGNNEERAGRARFFPSGVEQLNVKELNFNKETYDVASNAVRISAGIPKSEVGEAPEGMLGGKGFAEAMNSAFYRMCISPLQTFIEGLFNEIIAENGHEGVYFKLKFPNESIDPEKNEAKFAGRFTSGGITRDEYRASIDLPPLGGEEGKFLISPGSKGAEGEDPFGGGFGKPQNFKKPVDVIKDPIDVLDKPIDVKKRKPIDEEKAIELGEAIGIDWEKITIEEFMDGLNEEQEHYDTVNGDEETMANIALDHLNEDPNYYNKLKTMDVKKLMKHCGVDARDEEYYGAPITHTEDVLMPHQGANESIIVGIGGVGQEIRPAVWKPVTGEDPKLQEWVGGKLFPRAEAVYLVDRELAIDENHHLVPVTWDDKVDGVEGSIQHYVKDRQAREDVNTYDNEYVERAAVLDYITGQVDRINKNWLTHPEDDKRPVLIDSDLSFPVKADTKLRSTFVEAMKGRPLSSETCDSVYLLIGNHNLWTDLAQMLESDEAVANCLKRATEVYELRMIPISEA